ncbi:MAG: TatD family hydrolase [Patescibacteria group bacterium]|mgnify:CR=1 FL=1
MPPQAAIAVPAAGRISNGARFFDAHTHVQFAVFDSDYKEVIGRALDSGAGLINVGTQKNTSRRAVQIANEYRSGVYATVGLHPTHTAKSFHDKQELGGGEAARAFTGRGEEFDYDSYKNLAADPKVLAVGECGLDYYRIMPSSRVQVEGNNESGIKERQKDIFIKQIDLANEIKKPLMIHCREAFRDLIKILQTASHKLQSNPGIIHFFSGTKEDARELLNLGFSFTFGGVITFARDYDEIIQFIPLDRILSETDAPYVSPAPYRGKRNEPAYVVEVVKKLAAIKKIGFEEIREQILKNAENCFNLKLI